MKIIECVPNFSEGKNLQILDSISKAITSVPNIKLLNIDPGAATNRTVFTFVGEAHDVCEAAFRAVCKASELIDMRQHKGTHPRIGATDVLPLIPISGITLQECADLARSLAQRISSELGIPTYNYEAAATKPERRNLATVRAGEYEGLPNKLQDPNWFPDFGASLFTEQVAKSGATIVGARDFLIAVNFNLNTTSARYANAIALDVREKGRRIVASEWTNERGYWERKNNVKPNPTAEKVTIPGKLKGCKAIGWYIEEYGLAQVSMNITDISQTPLHQAFEAVSEAAAKRGLRVTGTEIIGLVPLKVLLEAGRYFLRKQRLSTGVSDRELIKIATCSMGLSDLSPFDARLKVIEYLMDDGSKQPLADVEFIQKVASGTPMPAGGSAAAYIGALGAALSTMVANLSSTKAINNGRWSYFSSYAEQGQFLISEMVDLVEEDAKAFGRVLDCLAMAKGDERDMALERAILYATEVPLRSMEVLMKVFDIAQAMVLHGNPNAVGDIGVSVLAVRSAILGAFLNVKINASSLRDRDMAEVLVSRASVIAREAQCIEDAILDDVNVIVSILRD